MKIRTRSRKLKEESKWEPEGEGIREILIRTRMKTNENKEEVGSSLRRAKLRTGRRTKLWKNGATELKRQQWREKNQDQNESEWGWKWGPEEIRRRIGNARNHN